MSPNAPSVRVTPEVPAPSKLPPTLSQVAVSQLLMILQLAVVLSMDVMTAATSALSCEWPPTSDGVRCAKYLLPFRPSVGLTMPRLLPKHTSRSIYPNPQRDANGTDTDQADQPPKPDGRCFLSRRLY